MVSKGAGWAVSHLKEGAVRGGGGLAECDIKMQMQMFVGGELSVPICTMYTRFRGQKNLG